MCLVCSVVVFLCCEQGGNLTVATAAALWPWCPVKNNHRMATVAFVPLVRSAYWACLELQPPSAQYSLTVTSVSLWFAQVESHHHDDLTWKPLQQQQHLKMEEQHLSTDAHAGSTGFDMIGIMNYVVGFSSVVGNRFEIPRSITHKQNIVKTQTATHNYCSKVNNELQLYFHQNERAGH